MSGQFWLTLKFTFNIPIKSTAILVMSLQNKQNTSHRLIILYIYLHQWNKS